jgi:hypothetical protein
MTHELVDRVADLEEQMGQQIQASAELTHAVNELTNVLTSGKMALKILCYVASAATAIAMGIAWLGDHIKFN